MAAGGGGRRIRDEDLDSEFEYLPEKKRKSWRDDAIVGQKVSGAQAPSHSTGIPGKQLVSDERDKEEWRTRRFHLMSLDAYARHKTLVNQYLMTCGKGIESFTRSTAGDRNDYHVLMEQHRFLWDESTDTSTWEKRLAKEYYDRLFKEYAIADLRLYKENKIAMRWRVEKEVIEGKGQFICGSKHCSEREDLQSWEVNFAYVEQGEKKNALVKLRLCTACSKKLNYHHKRKPWKKRSDDKHSKRKHKSRSHSHKDASSSHETREGEEESDSEVSEPQASSSVETEAAENVWSKPAEAFLEKSKEVEFEDYFKDMLL